MEHPKPENKSSFPEEHPPEKKPSINNRWIYLSIIALLLGTNIYLFFQKKDTSEQNIQMVGQIDSVITEKEILQLEYDASLARLDKLNSANAELEEKLKLKDIEIEKAKSRIQSILDKENSSELELKEARNLLASLNSQITEYEKQIAVLIKANETLQMEMDAIVVENEELFEQIELAKIINITNIKLTALNIRKSGKKQTETSRAKRADVLRITFDVIENRFTEKGEEEFNIRIVNPKGMLLSNAALGSGSFLDEEGETIFYSVSKRIDITPGKPKRNIVVDWNQGADYVKGPYVVEVYHKGFLVGSGSVSLR